MIDSTIQDNISVLKQGIDLLTEIDPQDYTKCCPQCFDSHIGGHLRHNIEHYQSFLKGYQEGMVDYDDRARDTRIETDITFTCDTMKQIIQQLERLGQSGVSGIKQKLQVKMDCGSTPDAENWSNSTVQRELQFLLSHTIHHYALIAVICRIFDYKLPKEFGVAPSTLKYQDSQASCAH